MQENCMSTLLYPAQDNQPSVQSLKPNTRLDINDLLCKSSKEDSSMNSTHPSIGTSMSEGAMASGSLSNGSMQMTHYASTGESTRAPAPLAATCNANSTSDLNDLDSKDRSSHAVPSTSIDAPPPRPTTTKPRKRQTHACGPCHRMKSKCEYKDGASVCSLCERCGRSSVCQPAPRARRAPRVKQSRSKQALPAPHLQVPSMLPRDGFGSHSPADSCSEVLPTQPPVPNLSSNVIGYSSNPMSTSGYDPSMNAHWGDGLAGAASVSAELYAPNAPSYVPSPRAVSMYPSEYNTSNDSQRGFGDAQTAQTPNVPGQETVAVAAVSDPLVLRSSSPAAWPWAQGGW